MLDSVPERRRRILTSRRVSIAGILLVLAGTAAALVIAGVTGEDERGGGGGGGGGEEPTGTEVELQARDDFDPLGDDGEHPDEAELAIDGDPATSWPTEEYTASAVARRRRGQAGRRADRRRRRAGRGHQHVDQLEPRAAGTPRSTRPPRARPTRLEEWGEPVGAVAEREPRTRGSSSTSPSRPSTT